VKLGLLGYDGMSRTRSYAILAIFVAAAILTPTPDIPTMLLMATPMIVLYEICIWLAYFDRKKARIREEQEARERMERLLAQEEQRKKDAPDVYHDEHSDDPSHHDWHAEGTGDDGWHEEYPQHDAHAEIEPPEPELPETELPETAIPTTSLPDSLPEEEERRRKDEP
jgi:hypothetical protein